MYTSLHIFMVNICWLVFVVQHRPLSQWEQRPETSLFGSLVGLCGLSISDSWGFLFMQGFVFSLAHRFFSNFRIIENTLCSLKPNRKNFNKHASDVWKLLLTFWCLFTLQLEKKVVELGKKQYIALEYRGLRQQIKPSCDPSTQRFEGQCWTYLCTFLTQTWSRCCLITWITMCIVIIPFYISDQLKGCKVCWVLLVNYAT